jgi:hypothetical protein
MEKKKLILILRVPLELNNFFYSPKKKYEVLLILSQKESDK